MWRPATTKKNEAKPKSQMSRKYIYCRMKDVRWTQGFFGFVGFLGIQAFTKGDWTEALWFLWFIWFIKFFPKKIKEQ